MAESSSAQLKLAGYNLTLQQAESMSAESKLAGYNLTPQQLAIYKRKFDVIDLNKDGVINMREFAAVSKVLGYRLSREEMLALFGKKDLDESGGITFDEFVVSLLERAQKTRELAPWRERFQLFDTKQRGYITSDEAYPVLKYELGFDMNKTETLLDMYDKNRDYRLSLPEFIEFIKRVDELKAQVQQAFREFDKNSDGFVDPYEARQVLLPKGFSEQQVDNLIRKFDKDADGKLNYTEFAAFWDISIL